MIKLYKGDCLIESDKIESGSEDFYHSGIWNMIEEIKNLSTGKIVKMQREKLNKYKPFIK